ncbi:MAG: cell division protein FtsQ/DivIB [Bacteroidota bacterium]
MLPTTLPFLIVPKIRHLIRGARLLLSSGLLVLAIVLAEMRQAGSICKGITIVIAHDEAQQFVEKQALLSQITTNTASPILGTPMRAIQSRKIENIIKSNNFVRTGIVYKHWQGELKIAIIPRRPIARIIYPHQQSQYVDEDGTLLPLSDRYTARVLLVDMEPVQDVQRNLKERACSAALLSLLNYINSNSFLRAQISYIHINARGKIVMHTQVGKQRIEFGTPEAIEKKFTRLALFYKQIVPHKGWSTYKRVNIEFDNQIVCE